jgi:hypothetical protein
MQPELVQRARERGRGRRRGDPELVSDDLARVTNGREGGDVALPRRKRSWAAESRVVPSCDQEAPAIGIELVD